MTIKEAIRILDPETSRGALLPYAYDPDRRLRVVNQACRVACAALRTQQTPSGAHGQWRGEGDGYADGEIVYDVWTCSRCGHIIDDGTDDPDMLPNYCPDCGAKMDGDTVRPPAKLNRSRWEMGGEPKKEVYICGATGLPCCWCQPGGCNNRKLEEGT